MMKTEACLKRDGARVKIPARVESATLARFFAPGEAAVVLKLLGVGNTAPFYLQDKAGRVLVLKWDSRAGGHVIRIPLSLWQANEARLAHDVMEHSRLVNAMIVTFELPDPETKRAAADADVGGAGAGAGVGVGVGVGAGNANASADAGERVDERAVNAEESGPKEATRTDCTAVSGSVTRTVSTPRAGRGRKAMAVRPEMTRTLTATTDG